jgi:hypothetical protein
MCRITLCWLFTTAVCNPILIALSVAVRVTWWPAWAPLSRPGLLKAYSREHRLGLLSGQETWVGDDVFAGLFKFDFMKATTATTNICFDTLKSFRGVQTYPCGMPSPFNSRRTPSPVWRGCPQSHPMASWAQQSGGTYKSCAQESCFMPRNRTQVSGPRAKLKSKHCFPDMGGPLLP